MTKFKLGTSYEIETGVHLTVRGFAKSTGAAGKKMGNLLIEEGTAHLFTVENLGEFIPRANEDGQQRTEWFVARGPAPGGMTDVNKLPESVRTRYNLDGLDFVTVRIFEKG